MKISCIQTILSSFLLVSCAGLSANAQAGEPFFHVTTTNLDDQVKIQYKDGTSLVDITSPSGIGSTKLELESGSMPEAMILRLHIQGLEQFRLRSAHDSLAASVSSRDASHVRQEVISTGSSSPLSPTHPLWMKIEIVGGQPKIPLEEGYFEITIPREFLRKAETSLEIEWIDFYR